MTGIDKRRPALQGDMGNIELLEDATERLPHTTRKMFGGHGLFAPNGGMFAGIVTDDAIMLKFADDAARSDFEEIGGRAWVYKNKTSEMTMREWILIPESFYDDPRQLAAWAARAYQLVPAKKASRKKDHAKKKAPIVIRSRPTKKAAPAKAKKPQSTGNNKANKATVKKTAAKRPRRK